MSIEVIHVTRLYGQQRAVDDLSFTISEGQIVGFLGPNGAGKSTTMKIITGSLPPTEGVARVGGINVSDNPLLVKRMTGYLAENNPLYLEMYVHEYLLFMAGLHGITGVRARRRVEEIVALCGLTLEQNKKIGMLSKGYRQRVGLAQALVHDPKVLVLDEPTSGLDPNQLIEIRALIRKVSDRKTVLFSTHIMQEVEALCDRVIVISQGRLVADDRLENLLRQGGDSLVVEFENEITEQEIGQLPGVAGVRKTGNFRFQIKAVHGLDLRDTIVRFAVEKNLSLRELKQEENSLESVFSQLTRQAQTTES